MLILMVEEEGKEIHIVLPGFLHIDRAHSEDDIIPALIHRFKGNEGGFPVERSVFIVPQASELHADAQQEQRESQEQAGTVARLGNLIVIDRSAVIVIHRLLPPFRENALFRHRLPRNNRNHYTPKIFTADITPVSPERSIEAGDQQTGAYGSSVS